MAQADYNSLAVELLKSGRVRARLSQTELALLLSELLGFEISNSTVSYWESQTHAMPAAVLLAACAITGQRVVVGRVKVDQLWRAIGEKIQAALARRDQLTG